jgi:hypothetical protein
MSLFACHVFNDHVPEVAMKSAKSAFLPCFVFTLLLPSLLTVPRLRAMKSGISIQPDSGSNDATIQFAQLPQDKFVVQMPEVVSDDQHFLLGPESGDFHPAEVRWTKKGPDRWVTSYSQPKSGSYDITMQLRPDTMDLQFKITNLSAHTWTYVSGTPHLAFSDAPDFSDPEQNRTFLRIGGQWVSIKNTNRDDGNSRTQWYIVRGHRPAQLMGKRPHRQGNFGQSPDKPDNGLVAVVSRDGKWVIGQAFQDVQYICLNSPVCVHPAAFFGTLTPGQQRTVKGKYYFLRGGLGDLLRRYNADFGGKASR